MADFTKDQIRAWCKCTALRTVYQRCPLHGQYDVEWAVFILHGPTDTWGRWEHTVPFLDTAELLLMAAQNEVVADEGKYRTYIAAKIRHRILLPWIDARA